MTRRSGDKTPDSNNGMEKLRLSGTPPPPPLPPDLPIKSSIDSVEHEDALLDIEQLEELQTEAERMKALGNKHMAAQVRLCFVPLVLLICIRD